MGSENKLCQRHRRCSERRSSDALRIRSQLLEKDAAEKAVKRVYGVKGIANDIEVKLFWHRTDPEIARDAVRELESHISIPADRIKVTVENGWVTLEGTVD